IKHKISLPLEEFADILDLPYDGPRFNLDEPEEGFMCSNIRLIHHAENHTLFPRKSKSGHLTRSDVVIMWLLANKIETNLASAEIKQMLRIKIKRICMPYGDMVMKILEHVGYNFKEEVSMQNLPKIGEATLGLMRYKIIDGEIFQNHPKGNK
ncbi:hypothetical protein RYX36_018758, partial [Vicia faba]